VGACSAAVSADSGHNTLVFDIDTEKIAAFASLDKTRIESYLHEKELAEMCAQHADHLRFTSDYQEVFAFLDTCDAVFMCLPTPEIGETGESNLTYYTAAAEQLAVALAKRNGGAQQKYVVIVNKSTVPIDMIDMTKELLMKAGVTNFGVVSNPEFLVEGKAIEGSIRPDRVVVGAESEQDFGIMRNIYNRFYTSSTVGYLEVSPKEAAAGKLLANYYLFSKLAQCFDVIGRTCEAFDDVTFENVRSIITADKRISNWGFYNSLYAGGSCLIKDARSLSHQLQTAGKVSSLVNETYLANKRQLELFLSRPETEAGFDWQGKTVALLGLAFKQDTNDTRNSPSLDIVRFLQEKRVKEVRLYDPVANDMFGMDFPASEQLVYMADIRSATMHADVVIIATDWPQFRQVAEVLLALPEKNALIMDGRRMLQHRYDELQKAGFSLIAVGSPFLGITNN